MNPGESVVEALRKNVLKIDDEWALARTGGWAWWPHRQRQEIFTDRERVEADGSRLRRVVVTTDVCRLKDPAEATGAIVLALASSANLSGLIRDAADPSLLRLHAHAWVDDDNLPLYKMILGAVAGIQAGEANYIAMGLAHGELATPAVSGHPVNGPRAEPDEIASVVEALIAPMGEAAPPWPSDMLEYLNEKFFCGPPCLMANADPAGLTAEYPFGLGSSLVRVDPDAENPLLGRGMAIMSFFDTAGAGDPEAGDPLALNAWEIEHGESTFLGSWSTAEGGGTGFITFIPNALPDVSVPATLILATARRAQLASQRWAGDDWSETWAPDGTCRAKCAAERMLAQLGIEADD